MKQSEWDYLQNFVGKTVKTIEESGFKGGAIKIVFTDDTEFTITHHLATSNPLAIEKQFTNPHTF